MSHGDASTARTYPGPPNCSWAGHPDFWRRFTTAHTYQSLRTSDRPLSPVDERDAPSRRTGPATIRGADPNYLSTSQADSALGDRGRHERFACGTSYHSSVSRRSDRDGIRARLKPAIHWLYGFAHYLSDRLHPGNPPVTLRP